MRRLHCFQVQRDVSCQLRSLRVLSMPLCMVLRRRRCDCHDAAWTTEAISRRERQVADNHSPSDRNRYSRFLVALLSFASLAPWHAPELLAAPIDKYLGVPVAKVQFTSEDFIDVTALEQAAAV